MGVFIMSICCVQKVIKCQHVEHVKNDHDYSIVSIECFNFTYHTLFCGRMWSHHDTCIVQ